MRRIAVALVLIALGFAAGSVALPADGERDATAQNTDADRIAALETQVATQNEMFLNFSRSIGPMLLPPPDPAPTYASNTIFFNAGHSWRMYCGFHDTATLNHVWAFDCVRADPANDPLINR